MAAQKIEEIMDNKTWERFKAKMRIASASTEILNNNLSKSRGINMDEMHEVGVFETGDVYQGQGIDDGLPKTDMIIPMPPVNYQMVKKMEQIRKRRLLREKQRS